jgi:DNA-binding winged helix-turn-helix (wHTH) protein
VPEPTRFRFGEFLLDTGNRSLQRAGAPVALNARYFDALVLLVREHGQMVGKQRLFDDVWAGSVVTDAALTQCIKEVRRALGDDAANPRFVRTVAGHGYSFIAAVQVDSPAAGYGSTMPAASADPAPAPLDSAPAVAAASTLANTRPPIGAAAKAPRWLLEGAVATLGGGAAGLLGGLLYGSALAVAAPARGVGSLSVLLVLVALSVVVGLVAAFGTGFGLALGRHLGAGPGWSLAGAATGGLAVGGLANLLGTDAFTLLVGKAPDGLTGGLEGAAIGLALAAGLVLGGGGRTGTGWRPAAWAAACTGLAGALVALAGGSLMATSLARIAIAFDHSRLDLRPLGGLFGQPQFGVVAQLGLGALEGAIFGGCVAAALLLLRRRMR